MFAYIAVSWNDADAHARIAANAVLDHIRNSVSVGGGHHEGHGFAIYDVGSSIADDTITRIKANSATPAGVIFGRAFRSDGNLTPTAPIRELNSTEAESLVQSEARSCLTKFWGSYIAFLRVGATMFVVTDPTCSIPCFYMQYRGLTIIFSHLEKCTFLDRTELSIDSSFVSDVLAYDKIQNGRTGLKGIFELLGGQKLTIGRDTISTETIWDPREIARDALLCPPDDAANLLYETTRYVVQSWGSAFDSIAVNLSGGLDSTIVLSCLAEAKAHDKLLAIHHTSDSGDPSEAHYARAVSEFFGCDLLEIPFSAQVELPRVDQHPLTARPYRQYLAPDMTKISETIQSRRRIDAIFTGQGGDHLFRETSSALGFADVLMQHPLSSDLRTELLNAARLSNRSVWFVLRESLLAIFLQSKPGATELGIRARCSPYNKLAHDKLSIAECLPSWCLRSRGIPPAKFDQVSSLMHLFLVRETIDRPVSRDVFHPLISQPLIELSLRLPISMLCAKGVSRGLTRTAFKGRIPETIRMRMTKGETTRHHATKLANNYKLIAHELLHGELATRGLVSREQALPFMSEEQVRTHKLGHRILIYYTIEAWLRSWTIALQRHPDAPAIFE